MTDRDLQTIGESAYAAIVEMVEALDNDRNTRGDPDAAREAILEDALSVQVRSDWYTPGGESAPYEYELLLATGGPAVRIVGTLDRWCEPDSARLEVQDWFTPWTEYAGADESVLLAYARCFYFGEG